MTKEEITRMAREAGKDISQEHGLVPFLERFANLVAAHEREECAKTVANMAEGKWAALAIRERGAP
jgi:hypothetical protein